VTVVLSENPDAPLATTRTVELPAGVCVEVEPFGEEPHAVIAAHTTPNTTTLSTCQYSRGIRLLRRSAPPNSPGTISSAASAVIPLPGRNCGSAALAVAAPVCTVIVTLPGLPLPPNVIEAGWKLHVAPSGRPVHENCTVPLNPGAAEKLRTSVTLPALPTVSAI